MFNRVPCDSIAEVYPFNHRVIPSADLLVGQYVDRGKTWTVYSGSLIVSAENTQYRGVTEIIQPQKINISWDPRAWAVQPGDEGPGRVGARDFGDSAANIVHLQSPILHDPDPHSLLSTPAKPVANPSYSSPDSTMTATDSNTSMTTSDGSTPSRGTEFTSPPGSGAEIVFPLIISVIVKIYIPPAPYAISPDESITIESGIQEGASIYASRLTGLQGISAAKWYGTFVTPMSDSETGNSRDGPGNNIYVTVLEPLGEAVADSWENVHVLDVWVDDLPKQGSQTNGQTLPIQYLRKCINVPAVLS